MSKNICPIIWWSYLLFTPWNSPSWEEITQLVEKCSAFYGTRWFINVFIRCFKWTISWATWNHSAPSQPISFISTTSYLTTYPWPPKRHPSFRFSIQNVFLLPISGSFVDPYLTKQSFHWSEEMNMTFHIGMPYCTTYIFDVKGKYAQLFLKFHNGLF